MKQKLLKEEKKNWEENVLLYLNDLPDGCISVHADWSVQIPSFSLFFSLSYSRVFLILSRNFLTDTLMGRTWYAYININQLPEIGWLIDLKTSPFNCMKNRFYIYNIKHCVSLDIFHVSSFSFNHTYIFLYNR